MSIYTEAFVGLAVRVLASSESVPAACKALAKQTGQRVEPKNLKKAFERRGLGTPASYLHCNDLDELTGETEKLGMYASGQNERILVLGDCHFPWVQRDVWALMLRFAKRFKPTRIICLGDFLDAFSISSHSKDPNRVALFDQEVDSANEGLDDLDALGAAHKDFIEGNHCYRLVRLLMDKAPALYNQISIPKLLRLQERGWTFTPYRQHLKVGHVYYTHDTGSAGATAHTKAGQDFQGSVVIGHVHRLASTYFGDAHGKQHVAIAAGWLGDANACDYMHAITAKKAWMNGWVTGIMEPDGTTHFQLHPVVDGKVRLGDEVIS